VADVSESNVNFFVPDYEKVTSRNEVFYNPLMSFNRDISLLYIMQKSFDSSILCGMAGTGIRPIRYALSGFTNVTANDINPKAYELIKRNSSLNKVDIKSLNMDFNLIKGKYDIIDIDPFGAPVRYVHPAFGMFGKTGTLLVTATDTAALCGSSKKACLRKYSAHPLMTGFCHEIGLRILIGYIARQAASWDYGIVPRVSFFKDHYMRTHIDLEKGKQRADTSIANLGFIYYCDKCLNRFFSSRIQCECGCGGKLRAAHPVWGGRINDKEALCGMLGSLETAALHDETRVRSFISLLMEEVDVPFFWDSHNLFSHLKIHVPAMNAILEKIIDNGFEASRTHFKPTGFKTDASHEELVHIFSSK